MELRGEVAREVRWGAYGSTGVRWNARLGWSSEEQLSVRVVFIGHRHRPALPTSSMAINQTQKRTSSNVVSGLLGDAKVGHVSIRKAAVWNSWSATQW
jgi:hypothetical protein